MDNLNIIKHLNSNYIEQQKWGDLVIYLEDKLLNNENYQNEDILEIYRKASYIHYNSSSYYSDFLYQHYMHHHWLYSPLVNHAFRNYKSDLLYNIYPTILLEHIAMTIADDEIIGNFFASAWRYRGFNRLDAKKWPCYDLAASFIVTILYFINQKDSRELVYKYFKEDTSYHQTFKIMTDMFHQKIIHHDGLRQLQQELESIAKQRQYWQDYTIDHHDAWIKTLLIFKKYPQYKKLHHLFAKELATQDIDMNQCVIIGFNYKANIGENFIITQSIISWAQANNINVVVATPNKHYDWVCTYFSEYCRYIFTYDGGFPGFSGFIPVAPSNIVAMNVINVGFAGKYMSGYDNSKYNNDFRVATRSANIDLIKPNITIDDDVKTMFQQYNLLPNNTVVLSLSSVSQEKDVFSYELLYNFWCDLIIALQQHNFQTVINAPNSEERDYSHLENTLCLHIPLDRIVGFVNHAGYFIGERSGLCDMLSISNARRYYIDVKGYGEYPMVEGFTHINVDRAKYHDSINSIINNLRL